MKILVHYKDTTYGSRTHESILEMKLVKYRSGIQIECILSRAAYPIGPQYGRKIEKYVLTLTLEEAMLLSDALSAGLSSSFQEARYRMNELVSE